jgi:hypothetical protein
MRASLKKYFLEWQIRLLKKILGSIGVVAIITSCSNSNVNQLKQENDSLKIALKEKEQLDSIEMVNGRNDSLEKIKKDSVEKLKSKNTMKEKQKQKTKVIPVVVPTYDPGQPTLDYGVYPVQKVEPTIKQND